MRNRYNYPLRRHLLCLLWIAPALAAVWALPAEAPYAHMLFDGGREVFRHNLCELILMPYVGLFMLALGTLLLPRAPASADSRLTSADFELIRFFGGAGLLVIFGFALGAANLLVAWITVPILVVVLYLHLLSSPSPVARFFGWLGATDLRESKLLRMFGVPCRCSICLLVLLIALEKGIVITLAQNDSLQLYFPYFAEVRRLHGIWLDPELAIIFGFLVGRGHGVQLFFTSFTDQFFIQAVSVVYFVAIAMVVRRVVHAIIPGDAISSSWRAARALFPDCAMLLALSSPLLQLDSGKFHFETGAFLMCLSWASLLFGFMNAKQTRWLGFMLLPIVLALPLAIPQTQVVVTMILVVAAWISYQSTGKRFARTHVLLILAGCVTTALSLLLNQLYLGLAEVNPYQFFLKFVNAERFHQWSSVDLIVYVSNAQGFDYLNDFPRVAENFIVSIGKLAEGGEMYFRRLELTVSTTPIVFLLLVSVLVMGRLKSGRRRAQGAQGAPGGLLDHQTDAFVVGFFALYVVASLLISLSGHGSLQRLMSYLDVYPAIFLIMAVVLFGTAFERFASGIPT